MEATEKPRRKRAPGAGRPQLLDTERLAVTVRVRLTEHDARFVERMGGTEWLRCLIKKAEIESRII